MSYFNSAARIIDNAMFDAGYLGEGQVPTNEQYARNLDRLNDMVNLWQTQGLKLWLLQDLPVTLVAGQSTYTFGPSGTTVMTKPMRVIEGYYADANQIRRPLIPLSWNDKNRLSQITQLGPINSYFVDKQATQLSVFFWLIPDTNAATGLAHLLTQVQAPNMAQISSSTLFPQEWFLALRWGLADEIATGQPQAIMDRCEKRAGTYRTALEDWDVEDAPTQFQPDSRMQTGRSSFT